jgi:hypothetical protein
LQKDLNFAILNGGGMGYQLRYHDEVREGPNGDDRHSCQYEPRISLQVGERFEETG